MIFAAPAVCDPRLVTLPLPVTLHVLCTCIPVTEYARCTLFELEMGVSPPLSPSFRFRPAQRALIVVQKDDSSVAGNGFTTVASDDHAASNAAVLHG